ncbi:MAG TPA: hypothetical protein VFN67_21320, partial [Polyangiales bacterium]|nr:hypothetical protein [Polyangiales bacterium]
EQIKARESAVADAFDIAGQHLRLGHGSVEELSAVLVWMHGQARRDAREPWDRKISAHVLDAARRVLQTLSTQQSEQLLLLLSFNESNGLGTPRFTAALDVVTSVALTAAVDANSLVSAYVATFRPKAMPYYIYGTLTPAQAASLALAANGSTAWRTFLEPFDVRKRVEMSAAAESQYVPRDELVRGLRAHIRVLSRAIVAWEGVPPADLIEALAAAICSGSSDNPRKGRVGAFAAQYEAEPTDSSREPLLMDDIASACGCVPSALRSSLQYALGRIDEPCALARLLQSAPAWMRPSLKAQLDALTYEEAAEITSLTEMAGRIDQLLNAGLASVAAKYMAVELGLTTLGHVRGRAVARLRWKLRVALLQKEFSQIAQATVPDGLEDSEVAAAHDVIAFFKGLAELRKPNGSAAEAEQLFSALAARQPGNAAYVVNLFAARVSRLLGGQMFTRLSASDIPIAREALSAAEMGLEGALGVRDPHRTTHESNRALLLLAIGEHEAAYRVLQTGHEQRQDDTLPAYAAVALARMGRVEEAHAYLAGGEALHPESDVLKAAREYLEQGRHGRFRVPSVANDDSVASVQSALFRLTQMDPGTQARVVSHDTSESHITDLVRSAAAGVTATVPRLREVRLQEDDVTAFLRPVLQARVGVFGWSVSDGSQGGYSAIGNPGVRDLVLRKDGHAIAVIEAMICNANPASKATRRDLTSHFQKLFGYDECCVFYHVVYSYLDEPLEVTVVMREVAMSSAPPAFTFSHIRDLPHGDARPPGFVATYFTQGGGEVRV